MASESAMRDADLTSREDQEFAPDAVTEAVGAGGSPTSGLNFAPNPSCVGGYVNGSSSESAVPDRGSGSAVPPAVSAEEEAAREEAAELSVASTIPEVASTMRTGT